MIGNSTKRGFEEMNQQSPATELVKVGMMVAVVRDYEARSFIVRGIPQCHMVGGISLIWAIPT